MRTPQSKQTQTLLPFVGRLSSLGGLKTIEGMRRTHSQPSSCVLCSRVCYTASTFQSPLSEVPQNCWPISNHSPTYKYSGNWLRQSRLTIKNYHLTRIIFVNQLYIECTYFLHSFNKNLILVHPGFLANQFPL